ncbi:MAG: hypothetical protein ACI4GV_02160 [Acutalibacteraceae bacterium]
MSRAFFAAATECRIEWQIIILHFNKMNGSPRPLRSEMDSPSAARLTDI